MRYRITFRNVYTGSLRTVDAHGFSVSDATLRARTYDAGLNHQNAEFVSATNLETGTRERVTADWS